MPSFLLDRTIEMKPPPLAVLSELTVNAPESVGLNRVETWRCQCQCRSTWHHRWLIAIIAKLRSMRGVRVFDFVSRLLQVFDLSNSTHVTCCAKGVRSAELSFNRSSRSYYYPQPNADSAINHVCAILVLLAKIKSFL